MFRNAVCPGCRSVEAGMPFLWSTGMLGELSEPDEELGAALLTIARAFFNKSWASAKQKPHAPQIVCSLVSAILAD